MLTLFPSGLSDLGCCHIPEALGPLDGLSWGWGRLGGCASQWALPHGPGGHVPLCTGPQPPDPGGSSCSETTPTAPKGRGASGLEELWKPPGLHVSRWQGSRLQLPSFGSPHLWWKHLHKVVLQESGCVQGMGVRKEEGMGRSLGCFFWRIPL